MSLTVKDLSDDQREAYEAIVRWVGDPDGRDLLSLGGYAGSGKSTLVSLVAEQVDLPAFCAYTGKAASVLRRKLAAAGTVTVGAQKRSRGAMSTGGRPYCGTIHGLIYRPCDCREPKTVEVQKPCPEKDCASETGWTDGQSRCGSGHVGLVKTVQAFEDIKPEMKFVYVQKGVDGRCQLCDGKGWLPREVLDRNYGLIIVDEASMVDDTMLRDLREYGVPILAVGDHGQLPPVGGSGSLMKAPHLRLEKIHRQAEGNPIIALSKIIRETGRIPDDMPDSEAVRFGRLQFVKQIIEERYADASAARLLEMGLAVYTNKLRCGLNLAVRRVRCRSMQLGPPRVGEHVVCLRNIKEHGGQPPVANGMRGVLQSDAVWKQEKIGESETHLVGSISFPEDEIGALDYEMFAPQFNREKTFSSPEELARETGIRSFQKIGNLFDFGYAMTVHKMQGSQFDDLVVCAERPPVVSDDDYRRWAYTAVTRAASKLTVLR